MLDARSGFAPPLPTARFHEFLYCLLHLRTRLVVRNDSMLPGIRPGDELFLNPRAYRRTRPRPGDIVVARHPRIRKPLLKRVVHVTAEGCLFLTGDNPDASHDSRQLGLFAPHAIHGRVTSQVRTS